MRKVRGLRPGPPACYYFASAVASGAGAADDVGAGSEVASAVAVESPPGVSVVGVEQAERKRRPAMSARTGAAYREGPRSVAGESIEAAAHRAL